MPRSPISFVEPCVAKYIAIYLFGKETELKRDLERNTTIMMMPFSKGKMDGRGMSNLSLHRRN